jgi:hypothetical protein
VAAVTENCLTCAQGDAGVQSDASGRTIRHRCDIEKGGVGSSGAAESKRGDRHADHFVFHRQILQKNWALVRCEHTTFFKSLQPS